MSLEITVRGTAHTSHRAERATLRMAAAVQGADRMAVARDATALQSQITAQLGELVQLEAVTTWFSDQVRVASHRPWSDTGEVLPLVHSARVEVEIEFVDFDRMSGFVDHWAAREGIEIHGISWDVAIRNRRRYEAEVRRLAVEDAVAKAQAYADALRRGKVVAVQLADPDMLHAGSGSAPPMMAARASMMMPDPAAESFSAAPRDIVIDVAVDAVFRAE